MRLYFRENEFENLYLESQSDWILLFNEFSNFIFRIENMKKIYSIFSIFYIFIFEVELTFTF